MVADGEPFELSPELRLLASINKWGVEAVMGRVLSYHEIICMNTAEMIVRAYNERGQAEDWVKWGQENPESHLLNEAMRLAHGEEPN